VNDLPIPLPEAESDDRRVMREMNAALLVSSVRQHELVEQARQAERALAKALVYTNDIIATLREPFLILDHDLRVKTANRSFYDTFRVIKEETEGRLVYELGNHQWDIPDLRRLLDEVLSRNQSVHDFEVGHTFPTLGRKIMLLNARPFPPDSQHPELILLALYDVSALRLRAEELADLHRRKDEFLAMLSHELRNPLAPIANAVQMLRLQREGENDLERQARGIIERQVGQLKLLVDDLLEVSRVTTGRIQLHRERTAVAILVEGAVETARPLIVQRRHELTVSQPAQLLWLYADAARLEQVMVNLLTNAAKYTEEGGHIWLTVEQDGDAAVLRVRDTGIGMAPELLPRIFDLFTQAERSLDRSEGGLGIGLCLVQRLVELHGGTVEAYSVLGKGSEFVVRLPLTSLPPLPAPATATVLPSASLRVLVVDDNVDAADSLAMLLRASRHDVRTAHDGPTALEVALDYRPDVVLLDIGLPGLNGFEVAKRVHQQPTIENIVLVAMTGYGLESDRQRSQEAGFDYHLVKPVDFGELQKVLATVPKKAT
jgi:signal transduction histidine kinase/ActR/RegA family two-component response regulator